MALIELTKGKKSIIDDEDFALVSAYKWHLAGRYAGTQLWDSATKKRTYLMMHNLIIHPPEGHVVDHINGDPLDNRRSNLRIASNQQNSWNRRPRSDSGLLGVRKSGDQWMAAIYPNLTPISLGTYETKELAAAAYNEASKVIYGEFASLNDVEKVDGILDRIISAKKKSIERLQQEIKFLTEGLE